MKHLRLKEKVFIIIFSLISYTATSQTSHQNTKTNSKFIVDRQFDIHNNPEIKKQIDVIGVNVAKRLMNCCSSWGGNNIFCDIDYYVVKMDPKTGTLIIPMIVGWEGSLSGKKYWIEGKLLRYIGGRKKWIKIRDSSGFSSGCSIGCIK